MDLSMPPVPPLPPHAISPPLPLTVASSPQQQVGPPPSPATSPRPLALGGAAPLGTPEGVRAARSLAEELQAGLMPLLDPRGRAAVHGTPGLERPYARDECVHVFRVRSKRTGRSRSLVAWLGHTKNTQDNLLMAIRCNDASRVRLLAGMGADVNQMDNMTRQTPLQLAESIGSLAAAAVLMELGALRSPQPSALQEAAVAPRSSRRDLVRMLLGEETLQRIQMGIRRRMAVAGGASGEEGPGVAAVGPGRQLAPVPEQAMEPIDPLRVSRRLMQARELLRSVRRRRVASEMGRVMDQMENLNLQTGDASARAAEPPKLDVSQFSRLSLTPNGSDSDSKCSSQPQGGASGHQ